MKNKTVDLLTISNGKRNEVIREIKRHMQQEALREKLLQSLLNIEPSAINKEMITDLDERLNSLTFPKKYQIG
jgi:hypothetical protein